jgi:hypothetical protein
MILIASRTFFGTVAGFFGSRDPDAAMGWRVGIASPAFGRLRPSRPSGAAGDLAPLLGRELLHAGAGALAAIAAQRILQRSRLGAPAHPFSIIGCGAFLPPMERAGYGASLDELRPDARELLSVFEHGQLHTQRAEQELHRKGAQLFRSIRTKQLTAVSARETAHLIENQSRHVKLIGSLAKRRMEFGV